MYNLKNLNRKYKTTLDVIGIAVGFEKIKREKGKQVRYPIYIDNEMMETDIEMLELSVRSRNCLRRHGYHTVGQLVEGINAGEDLKKLRNCGNASVLEIMLSLMCYQFMLLDKNGQRRYIEKMQEMNR